MSSKLLAGSKMKNKMKNILPTPNELCGPIKDCALTPTNLVGECLMSST
jgi:hypothetical protein